MPSARGVALAKTRSSVVVLSSLAIVSVLVYLLTGGSLLEEKVTLYLLIPDATGLDAGSPVRVNGTDVGKVRGVALSGSSDPDRIVRLTMRVERAHLRDIPADSLAQLSSDTMIGDRYVDIQQGQSTARIQPDGEIRFKAQPELLKSLDVQQFARQLRIVDATLTDIEQGKSPLGQFVRGREFYDKVRQSLDLLDAGFRDATSATSRVGQFLTTDRDYRQILDPLAEIDERLARIQAGQGPLGQALREDGQYTHFLDQTAELRRSVAEFRKQDFMASDSLYNGWNKTVLSLIRRVDDINSSPMFTNSLDYDNLTVMARQLRDSIRDLRENPKKYLRIDLF